MSNLDDIVSVKIDLSAPASDAESFDTLLVLGPAPSVGTPPAVGAYRSLKEVTDAGWTAVGPDADPVGVAARIAFAQSPQPSNIYIAARQYLKPLVSDVSVKIITSGNLNDVLPDGLDDTPTTLPWIQVAYKAASDLTIEIEKGGSLVYGGVLPAGQSFFRAALGTEGHEGGPTLDIESQSGIYAVTLSATKGTQTTQVVASVSFDGTGYETLPGYETPPILESLGETLDRAVEYTGWYVVCPAGIPENQYEQIAQWTEAQTKLFAFTYLSEAPPVGSIYYRSMGWYGKEFADQAPEDVPQDNHYLHVAAVAVCLAYEAGSETWAHKQLASVYPSRLSGTQIKALKDKNVNYFTTYARKNVTQNGVVMAGEWIDTIRLRDWLKNDMQSRVYNLLLVEPKVPYTDRGIGLVETQMIASLKSAQTRGGVSGDQYDENETLVPGYVVTVPRAASISGAQRVSRILSGCKFRARLANAIHAVEITGGLIY
jgi:hypothetical protein